MNICFYTTDHPSASTRLNINHLVQSRPGHNYSFLNIRKAQGEKKGIKDQIKAWYGTFRFDDGRFDLQRDYEIIHKRLEKYIAALDKNNFAQGYADEINDEKSVKFLRELKPDLIVQAGAGIMTPATFSLAKTGTINLHHGIMPEIRGIESTFWCLFYGIKDMTGVSCHFIDETIDTGTLIAQAHLNSPSTSFIDIQTENYLLGREVLLQSVDILDKGGYTVKKTGPVKSYYFGMVNPFLYYALKKRNFEPVMKIGDRAFKSKEKSILIVGT